MKKALALVLALVLALSMAVSAFAVVELLPLYNAEAAAADESQDHRMLRPHQRHGDDQAGFQDHPGARSVL